MCRARARGGTCWQLVCCTRYSCPDAVAVGKSHKHVAGVLVDAVAVGARRATCETGLGVIYRARTGQGGSHVGARLATGAGSR